MCLKKRGSTSSPKRTWLGTINVSPLGDQRISSSVLGSSTMLRSLFRKAGLLRFITVGCGTSPPLPLLPAFAFALLLPAPALFAPEPRCGSALALELGAIEGMSAWRGAGSEPTFPGAV